MKNKILILICDMTALRYFESIIKALISLDKFDILIVARYDELAQKATSAFPTINVATGYRPDIINDYLPDILICYQIWWWEIRPVLKYAKSRNIPILHYEHGSLIFMSEFLLYGDEQGSHYRSDISLCSHIACWGNRNKECWTSYGVLEEKLHLTGAPHLDILYVTEESTEAIFKNLNIGMDKKIILLYTNMTGQIPEFDEKCLQVVNNLRKFADNNPTYQLVIKPHPSEMLWFDGPKYDCSSNVHIVAHHFEDSRWQKITRINVDNVAKTASVVVAPTSSVLITPVILNVPTIHIEVDEARARDLTMYCADAIISINDPGQIETTLVDIDKIHNYDSSSLARLLNFNNDGKATDRFITLIENIMLDIAKGTIFYLPEEQEFSTCIKRYPFIPYPYRYLINYYSGIGDYDNEEYYVMDYCRKFKDSVEIIKEVLKQHVNTRRDYDRMMKYCSLYRAYRQCDLESLNKLHMQAEMLINGNELSVASNIYFKIIEEDPASAQAYHNLALIFLKQGEVSPATHFFMIAVFLDPGNKNILKNCCEVLKLSGLHNEALSICNKYLATNPDDEIECYLLSYQQETEKDILN